MNRLDELMARREKLDAEIEEEMKSARADALTDVQNKCKTFGFTAPMLKGFLKTTRQVRKPKAVKDEGKEA